MKTPTSARVMVLGASSNPERVSNQVVRMLLDHGYEVVPVHPKETVVHGIPVVKSLSDVGSVHTLSLYVNPEISSSLADEIVALKIKRVLFSPGAENPALKAALNRHHVETLDACTLVLLRTGQF